MKNLEFNPAIIAMSICGEEIREGEEILASVKREGECTFRIEERVQKPSAGGGSHRRNKKLLNGRYLSLVYMPYCNSYQVHCKRLQVKAGFDKRALGRAIGREMAEALAIVFDDLKLKS